MALSKSSKRWLAEHFSDPYVKRAQAEGMPSRAAYKLLDIQSKNPFIQPGMRIVDLGAAPGGWSAVASELVGQRGQVIAVDLLPMTAPAGVTFIQGDFTEQATLQEIMTLLQQQTVDVVLSDMAPNMSGMAEIDQPRMMYLAELALDFASEVLSAHGCFLIKVFQGSGFDAFLKQLRQTFSKVQICKPPASRTRSKEIYLLARGLK